jgi:hypothetical protein
MLQKFKITSCAFIYFFLLIFLGLPLQSYAIQKVPTLDECEKLYNNESISQNGNQTSKYAYRIQRDLMDCYRSYALKEKYSPYNQIVRQHWNAMVGPPVPNANSPMARECAMMRQRGLPENMLPPHCAKINKPAACPPHIPPHECQRYYNSPMARDCARMRQQGRPENMIPPFCTPPWGR